MPQLVGIMTSIVSRRATHREAATAPVATAETTGGSNERISFAIRWSRSNNYTAPLQRFKAASPYIFSTSRSRGHAVERLRDVDRGSSNVSSSLVSIKKGCRKKLSTIHDHRGNARSLFSPFFLFSISPSIDVILSCAARLGIGDAESFVRKDGNEVRS